MDRCWCGNDKLKEYSENYFFCSQCKSLVSKVIFEDNIYHVEDENDDLYGGNYWEEVMTQEAGVDTLDEIIDLYLHERGIYWLKYIVKYLPFNSRVAEIGCGLGQLAYLMRFLGYQQIAYELSPAICRYVSQKLGINIVCQTFGERNEKYDAILAMDVFEHILNPHEFLRECSEHITDRGILCLQTPCYDEALTYEKMRQEKPRFERLMVEEQHIFIYSKKSITQILERYGFTNIIFEPAFFGNDYDMFLFASKEKINVNTDEEIDNYLNSAENGRLIKAIITLFDINSELTLRYHMTDADSNARLKQVDELTKWLKENEVDRTARLEEINKLTGMLQESEADRAARLEEINKLSQMLRESEIDRESRMEQINKLTKMLRESEADREARMEQINALTEMLKKEKVTKI